MTKIEKLILENQITIMQALRLSSETPKVIKDDLNTQASKTFNELRDNK